MHDVIHLVALDQPLHSLPYMQLQVWSHEFTSRSLLQVSIPRNWFMKHEILQPKRRNGEMEKEREIKIARVRIAASADILLCILARCLQINYFAVT